MLYRYVSQSWQLTEFLFFIMCMLLLSFLQMLMLIQFSSLINSSSLCTLTFLRQESSLCCSVWTSCLYSNVLHQIKWELIVHCTSTQFWFRVRVCWFLLIVSTVRHAVCHFFQNVIVHQNISMSVAVTASDMITLLTVSYATMMFSLSSWMMRMTTMSMRINLLLSQEESH